MREGDWGPLRDTKYDQGVQGVHVKPSEAP